MAGHDHTNCIAFSSALMAIVITIREFGGIGLFASFGYLILFPDARLCDCRGATIKLSFLRHALSLEVSSRSSGR